MAAATATAADVVVVVEGLPSGSGTLTEFHLSLQQHMCKKIYEGQFKKYSILNI